jgi:hypothetical protein
MYTNQSHQSHQSHQSLNMEFGTLVKYILIATLIIAGYYVVTMTAKNASVISEGFSTSSSSETPGVAAKKSGSVLTDKAQSIVGFLQINDNRSSYEMLVEVMDAWTQGKIVASLNALSEQMIADSSDQNAMLSPPSDKTIALMNSLIAMTNFQSTVMPSALKYLDASN